ncbi:MAG: ATP-binding cassette domain-containing protein [Deinococcales bacterium]
MSTVLKTTHLNKFYRLGGLFKRVRINALDDVNLTVESDKPVIISLVGESGSGKTTLAKVILQLIKPSSGSAMIYDQVVAGEGATASKKDFLTTLQPIFQNPFEAFSAYRSVDSYLQQTAKRIGHEGDGGGARASPTIRWFKICRCQRQIPQPIFRWRASAHLDC